MGEPALEIRLEFRSAAGDMPGAIFELSSQQVSYATPISRVTRRYAQLMHGVKNSPGSVGVARELLRLRPSAIPAFERDQILERFFQRAPIPAGPLQAEELHVPIFGTPRIGCLEPRRRALDTLLELSLAARRTVYRERTNGHGSPGKVAVFNRRPRVPSQPPTPILALLSGHVVDQRVDGTVCRCALLCQLEQGITGSIHCSGRGHAL